MKFKFNHNHQYQLNAIDSILSLFDDLPKKNAIKHRDSFLQAEGATVSNPFVRELNGTGFFDIPVELMQEKNGLPMGDFVQYDDGQLLKGVSSDVWRYPSFSIEMETGTGKTYVYLRTIYRLYHELGFHKFIIIVPSVAIYQGVLSAYNAMSADLKNLHGNTHIKMVPYSGDKLSVLRGFGEDPLPQILLMTIAAFNKKSNNIYKTTEKLAGDKRPFEYIQAVKPVLIVDEPQSVDNTELARSAIRTLHPLFGLRFSATHRFYQNLIYKLSPAQAAYQNLVKKIQVVGVDLPESALNAELTLLGTAREKAGRIYAKVKVIAVNKGKKNLEEKNVYQGQDLYQVTGNKDYEEGYVVENIIAEEGQEAVYFENGELLTTGSLDKAKPAIFRRQIRETIREHFRIQKRLLRSKIKVLSLFFIDRVANYIGDEEKSKGIIRALFEEEYEKLRKDDAFFSQYDANEVQGSYFASYKKKGQTIYVDKEATKADERNAEKAAYELIMKDKARLLTFSDGNQGTPVAFIFAHSALREGWDNPNVFQICTLNQSVSNIKKRQEIGRGLRLCVNQNGVRIEDKPEQNILTVVANDSYKDYVENLQSEYDGDKLGGRPPRPTNAKRGDVKINKKLFKLDEFKLFWQKLTKKVSYTITLDTKKFIDECILQLDKTSYPEVQINASKGRVDLAELNITIKEFTGKNEAVLDFVLLQNSKQHIREEITVSEGMTLDRALKKSFYDKYSLEDNVFTGFEVVDIDRDAYDPFVQFKSGKEVTKEIPFRQTLYVVGKSLKLKSKKVEEATFPVFNLIERAAEATNLTRKTINGIFQGIASYNQKAFIKNPETFASIFIDVISKILRKYVAESIKFDVHGELAPEDFNEKLEAYFPATDKKVQKELIYGGEKSLYTKVQIDSEVERRFVNNRLMPEDKILVYFKFPNRFKINLPKILGNYNPDWGVIRENDEGDRYLELVRETKGTLDKEALRFDHEKHKITCAEKYFAALGIDYRQVTDQEPVRWWLPKGDLLENVMF